MKKTLGVCLSLAATAMLALVVMAPASASAAEFDFACKLAADSCFVHGESTETQTFKAGATALCTTATFEAEATTSNGATTVKTVGSGETNLATHVLTLKATYPKPGGATCTVAGQAATVSMNGCDYTFTLSSKTNANAVIDCPAGQEIVITAKTAGCTIKVGAQTPGTPTVKIATEGTPKFVSATPEVGGIKFTGSGGICGGSGSTGTYTGKAHLKCYSDAAKTKQVACTPVETVGTEIKE